MKWEIACLFFSNHTLKTWLYRWIFSAAWSRKEIQQSICERNTDYNGSRKEGAWKSCERLEKRVGKEPGRLTRPQLGIRLINTKLIIMSECKFLYSAQPPAALYMWESSPHRRSQLPRNYDRLPLGSSKTWSSASAWQAPRRTAPSLPS